MTPLENSLYVASVAPVLALVVSVFLRPAVSARWNTILLALSGIGGVVAGAYGAVAETPFTIGVPMFYGMTVALDRFSAIFFLGISLVIAAAGLYALSQAEKHLESGHARIFGILGALFVIGVQWTLLAGNIIGFVTAWATMMFAAFLFQRVGYDPAEKAGLSFVAIAQGSTLAIASGLFILSSGALFSDFGTLAYLSGELDLTLLIVGYGLLFFGFAAGMGIFPFHRAYISASVTVPAHVAVLFRGGLSGVALYGFIRCILFILPPLSIWFSLPIAVLGAFTMLCGAMGALNAKQIHRIVAQLSIASFGFTAVMIAGAMAFQSLAVYDAMNVMLFAAFIQLTVNTIATSGLFLAADVIGSNIDSSGGLAKTLPKFAVTTLILLFGAIGFPPSAVFTSIWMTGSTFQAMFANAPVVAVVLLIVGIVSLLFMIAAVLRVVIGVFFGESRNAEGVRVEPTDRQLVPIVLLALLTLVSGFALPQLLVFIGADPLTDAAGTFRGGIVTAFGTLRMGSIGLLILGVACIKWYFRESILERLPSFETLEAWRTNYAHRLGLGARFTKLWNGALEKLRR